MVTSVDMERLLKKYPHKLNSLPDWVILELDEKIRLENLLYEKHAEISKLKANNETNDVFSELREICGKYYDDVDDVAAYVSEIRSGPNTAQGLWSEINQIMAQRKSDGTLQE